MSRSSIPLLCLSLLVSCRGASSPPEKAEGESWSVTAWSEHYELFAETEPFAAGREAISHAHFTYLPDFSALDEGSVTGILRGADGGEQTFVSPEPLRAGIFNVAFRPEREGTYDLVFRVENRKASEEIAAGKVRVGSEASPGGLAAAPDVEAEGPAAGEPVGFLKEQQWRTAFATDWAREGSVREALRAPARVLAAGGGETTVTAPADGVVTAAPWPHVGREVRKGSALFVLTPRVAADRSLAELGADVAALEAELGAAEARLGRLRELVAVEAASRRELEEADARVTALQARIAAARSEQRTASAVRGGSGGLAETFRVTAPIAGRLAQVSVTPGQLVAAGAPLARIVKAEPVWLELALQPQQASRLVQSPPAPAGLFVRRWAEEEPFLVPAHDVRLVSRAPEVDPGTGTVAVILEVRRSVDLLRIGSRVEAELFLPRELQGIVIPASALVDDGGVEVVYVQLDGESFERREIQIEARQGTVALVRGIGAGERIVTRGGNAIRRAALLGSGAIEGHVH